MWKWNKWNDNDEMLEKNENKGNVPAVSQPGVSQSAASRPTADRLTVGQRNVKFGPYSWRVLDVKDGRALLLSEEITSRRAYHRQEEAVTWETSDLRRYLNGEFLRTFSGVEQSRIASAVNVNKNNPWEGTYGGNDTTDKIFLLSIEEIIYYLGDSGAMNQITGEGIRYSAFDLEQMERIYIENPDDDSQVISDFHDRYDAERAAKYRGDECLWWLRTPGSEAYKGTVIGCDGDVYLYGFAVNEVNGGVRPALWINMNEDSREAGVVPKINIAPGKFSDIRVGRRNVRFGKYNWRVLERKNGRALLLSEEILEKRAYNHIYGSITWEKSALREYLNGEFLRTFGREEQNRIVSTTNRNFNPWFRSSRSSDTTDRIFILSIDEVVKYFGDSGALEKKVKDGIFYKGLDFEANDIIDVAVPDDGSNIPMTFLDQYSLTRLAKYRGEESSWWLRTPGLTGYGAGFVRGDGLVMLYGRDAENTDGIRPAMWVEY